MSQKSGSILTASFWLKVSHEVIVRCQLGSAFIQKSDWGWRIHFQKRSLMQLASWFLSTWASPQDCLSGIMAWWLASSVRETKVKSCNAFRQALEFVHHHFHHVLSFPLTSCD